MDIGDSISASCQYMIDAVYTHIEYCVSWIVECNWLYRYDSPCTYKYM